MPYLIMLKTNKKKNLILIIIIFTIIILFGISLWFFYWSLPGNNPNKNKEFCEKAGWQWSDNQSCLLSNKKAWEVCIDWGQCISGVCFPPELSKQDKINLYKGPLENIKWTCYPDELVKWCIEQVIMWTISKETMCIDD